MLLLGFQSLSIVLLTSLFTGMVISLESAVQAVQYGFGSIVGSAVAYSSVRELGPMLTGVVVAGRAGAAIAAEIGSMVVTEQIEALTSMGLEIPRFLVLPRLLAMVVMLPLLTVFADVISIIGGMWIAQTYAHISYDTFLPRRGKPSASKTSSRDYSSRSSWRDHRAGRVVSGPFDTRWRGRRRRVDDGAVVISIILIFITNFVLSFILFGGH